MLVGGKGLTCVGGKLFSFLELCCVRLLGVFFSHSGYFFLSRRVFLSLTAGISFSHGGYFFLSQRVFLSLTEGIFFSHGGYFYASST
ncbi:hypothetical protein HMPREF0666_01515 [Prevotella sp. C561]|nr:hypothetical protein HMPREF0666_01515 [Prevotella sp. C561]